MVLAIACQSASRGLNPKGHADARSGYTGAVFVVLSETNPNLQHQVISNAKIFLPPLPREFRFSSAGTLAIDSVTVGSYALTARCDGYWTDTVGWLRVSPDSISLAIITLSERALARPGSKVWEGFKIPHRGLQRLGSVRVNLLGYGMDSVRAGAVSLAGTHFSGGMTDSSGVICLPSVLPGTYVLQANVFATSHHTAYYPCVVKEVRVHADSTSVVECSFVPEMVPEGPPPLIWDARVTPGRCKSNNPQ